MKRRSAVIIAIFCLAMIPIGLFIRSTVAYDRCMNHTDQWLPRVLSEHPLAAIHDTLKAQLSARRVRHQWAEADLHGTIILGGVYTTLLKNVKGFADTSVVLMLDRDEFCQGLVDSREPLNMHLVHENRHVQQFLKEKLVVNTDQPLSREEARHAYFHELEAYGDECAFAIAIGYYGHQVCDAVRDGNTRTAHILIASSVSSLPRAQNQTSYIYKLADSLSGLAKSPLIR